MRGQGKDIKSSLAAVRRRGQNNDALDISVATDEDIKSLRVLKRTFAERELKPLHGAKATKEWMRLNCNQRVIRQQLENGQERLVVARDGQKIVALANVEEDRQEHQINIAGMYLLEQDDKVATELAQHLEDTAREQGCQRARTPVMRSDEQYKRLMQARGFVGTGQEQRDPVFGVLVDYYEKEL